MNSTKITLHQARNTAQHSINQKMFLKLCCRCYSGYIDGLCLIHLKCGFTYDWCNEVNFFVSKWLQKKKSVRFPSLLNIEKICDRNFRKGQNVTKTVTEKWKLHGVWSVRPCTTQAWSGSGLPPDDTKAGTTRTVLRSQKCCKTSAVRTKPSLTTRHQQQRMTHWATCAPPSSWSFVRCTTLGFQMKHMRYRDMLTGITWRNFVMAWKKSMVPPLLDHQLLLSVNGSALRT